MKRPKNNRRGYITELTVQLAKMARGDGLFALEADRKQVANL
jgi:hypothetical protein